MEKKITLEELIDTLSEIKFRFKKNQPETFNDTGIVFAYNETSEEVNFRMSKEFFTDLKELYREKD